MKEFIDKLIERLEELKTDAIDKWDGGASHRAYSKSIEIVNQLAEEYAKDQNWQTTRNYLDEKYFSKIRELSAKYNHPCENVPINFDWVFGLIEKIEKKLAEEYKDNVIIDGQYCWQTCGSTEHCKECNRLCNGSIDYYENYDFMAEEHNNGWNACSERLPESGESVIVSYKDRFLSQADGTCEGWYDATNMIWHLTDYEYSDNAEVIAWRERLAPYQPKGE